MRNAIFLLVSLFVVGCSTTDGRPYSAPPSPPQGKALVYLMRSQVVLGSAYPTIFSINDSAVASMKDKGYSWLYLSPGIYTFSAGVRPHERNVKIVIPIELGKEYFVEYTQEANGYQLYSEAIKLLDPSAGINMATSYTQSEAW